MGGNGRIDDDGSVQDGVDMVARCEALGVPVLSVEDVVYARAEAEAVLSERGRMAQLPSGAVAVSPPEPTHVSNIAAPSAPADGCESPRFDELDPVDVANFRDVLGSVCTPVCVVTTMHLGRAHASTVSAFCSLSIDPPLILVALDRSSELLRLIRSSRVYGVNILADQQHVAALQLARKGQDKLADVDWVEDAGLPRLLGSAGWLACRVHRVRAGGDHMIVTGLVVRAEHEQREPLLYRRREFVRLS